MVVNWNYLRRVERLKIQLFVCNDRLVSVVLNEEIKNPNVLKIFLKYSRGLWFKITLFHFLCGCSKKRLTVRPYCGYILFAEQLIAT